MRFRGLPDGTWIVTSWNIRMFTAGETEHPLTGQPAATLEGVAITHGEVLRAHGDAGVVFEGHRGRRVVGTVVDSLGVGLPNARVYVRGSGTETETDAEGRFELDRLGAGTYALHFTHPYLERLWYEPEPKWPTRCSHGLRRRQRGLANGHSHREGDGHGRKPDRGRDASPAGEGI